MERNATDAPPVPLTNEEPPNQEPLPPPPTSAAMTLEQYRAYVASRPHAAGTVHATPPEEKAERDEKIQKRGWWPCQSYKCEGKSLNPKAAEKCEACGALRRLDSGSVFNASASASQIRWNADIRRK